MQRKARNTRNLYSVSRLESPCTNRQKYKFNNKCFHSFLFIYLEDWCNSILRDTILGSSQQLNKTKCHKNNKKEKVLKTNNLVPQPLIQPTAQSSSGIFFPHLTDECKKIYLRCCPTQATLGSGNNKNNLLCY